MKPSTTNRLVATIHIDHTHATATNGQTGAVTSHGLKVGPNLLREILCVGTVAAVTIDSDGLRLVDTATASIPPRIRDHIWWRDRGCTIDGCTSTYRLEPHHITERHMGGGHHPDNLTLLCWYHHHVVIHQRRFTIDPTSPPGRRRLRPPGDPPDT